MMRKFLLDTQIVMWMVSDDDRLKPHVKAILSDGSNELLVSYYSLMEIAIKRKIGKMHGFTVSVADFVERLKNDGIELLPISVLHIETYHSLTFFENHKDPFDRFILSVAKAENLTILSADNNFYQYESEISIIKC